MGPEPIQAMEVTADLAAASGQGATPRSRLAVTTRLSSLSLPTVMKAVMVTRVTPGNPGSTAEAMAEAVETVVVAAVVAPRSPCAVTRRQIPAQQERRPSAATVERQGMAGMEVLGETARLGETAGRAATVVAAAVEVRLWLCTGRTLPRRSPNPGTGAITARLGSAG